MELRSCMVYTYIHYACIYKCVWNVLIRLPSTCIDCHEVNVVRPSSTFWVPPAVRSSTGITYLLYAHLYTHGTIPNWPVEKDWCIPIPGNRQRYMYMPKRTDVPIPGSENATVFHLLCRAVVCVCIYTGSVAQCCTGKASIVHWVVYPRQMHKTVYIDSSLTDAAIYARTASR